jgi:hypothetical protein
MQPVIAQIWTKSFHLSNSSLDQGHERGVGHQRELELWVLRTEGILRLVQDSE